MLDERKEERLVNMIMLLNLVCRVRAALEKLEACPDDPIMVKLNDFIEQAEEYCCHEESECEDWELDFVQQRLQQSHIDIYVAPRQCEGMRRKFYTIMSKLTEQYKTIVEKLDELSEDHSE